MVFMSGTGVLSSASKQRCMEPGTRNGICRKPWENELWRTQQLRIFDAERFLTVEG
jgi:hypothetical protein